MRSILRLIAFSGIACAAVVLLSSAGCSSERNQATPTTGFAALNGKRLAGTSAEWIPISSPFDPPKNVATTISPPLRTVRNGPGANTFTSVAFFDFATSSDATTFYENPPVDARLNLVSIQAFKSLDGETAVPPPSRGVDLRSCVWEGGDNEGPLGSYAAGQLSASGECSLGHASSIGVATIIQRGPIVVIIESIGNMVVGGFANASELSQNAALAVAALKLLHQVDLI